VTGYVVGVDGSAASRAAVAWAISRAAADALPVRLVYVIDDEAGMLGEDYRRQAERDGLQILATATAEARAEHPSVPIRSSSLHGTVPWDLSHDATAQEVLVIGTQRDATPGGHVLGSRSVQIASITPATLVVVPSEYRAGTGPVVAGVSLREPGGPAIVRGAREAALAGRPLVIVASTGGSEGLPHVEDLARTRLSEAETLARSTEPGITVSTDLSAEEPSRALLDPARGADLVVLGPSRTYGMGVSPIGTVTQSVLLNTTCPVLVSRFTEGL
jgi:nucleotide-binding universal stress UspA family protein